MFDIFRPEADIFGKDYEKDKKRFQEVISFYKIENKPEKIRKRLIYNEESYKRFLELEYEFFHGKYKEAIKSYNGKIILWLYDGISADLNKRIYVIDRKLFQKMGGNMEELDLFSVGKFFYDNNLVFESSLGEKFNKLNKYSILLELIRLSFYNDIVKYKSVKIIRFLIHMNNKYLKWKGINYKDFIS